AAKRTRFAAYAVGDDNDQFNPEAMSKSLQTLLEHSHAQDVKLAELTMQLQALSMDTESDAEVATAFDVKSPAKK
ncbi:MAG: serine O-acetyltransferase, partial [Betaproteobacteria bacterium HGW-Betaproteobacteria-20]